ncbi:MAG TPA: peptidoglycan-binding domain-containing protein [Candidatus Omnitrophota bacterium]|nr:peptidoglycan-binding domain-containing protein [Candidatus Omnitrophota bacterium]
MWYRLIIIAVLAVGLVGCATTSTRKGNVTLQQLDGRVTELEKKIDQKDQQIREVKGNEDISSEEMSRVKDVNVSSDSYDEASSGSAKISPKNIQKALKKAGYYSGSVDGKIGRMTKKAVKDFQEANGLTADGVVGKKTWSKLKRYLD